MADEKLSELPLITGPLQTTDEMYVVRSGVSYQLTFDMILSAIPGAAVWGDITGNIDDQTDLLTELNDKVPKGPIFGGGSGLTIDNNTLAGRFSAGPGDIEAVVIGAGLRLLGGELQAVDEAAVWGSITGTLSDQTDLQAALDLKAPLNSPAFTGTPTGISASDVGLGSVTNDAQTKAAIVPNTAPAAAQLLLGNAGGTAYAPVSLSGPVSVDSAGLTAVGTLNQNTSGTAANLSGTPALPNGTTATTQSAADNSTKLATTAYADTAASGKVPTGAVTTSGLTMATGKILGRDTAGTGAIEELAETGSGNVVRATSPTLTTPILGTPTSGNLSNCTALPVGSVTGLGTGIGTFLATPSSANLAAALTDETGTGANVFADSPAFTTGMTLDAVDLAPQIKQNVQTGGYTLVLSDANKQIYTTTGGAQTWTIPANSSVAFPIGTTVVFILNAATTRTIAITTDTLYWAPSGATGSRTLVGIGVATAIKVAATVWVITGVGLT